MWETISLRGVQRRRVRDRPPRQQEESDWKEIPVPRGRGSRRCWFMQYYEDGKWQIGSQQTYPRIEPLYSLEELATAQGPEPLREISIRRWFNIDTGTSIPTEMLIAGKEELI